MKAQRVLLHDARLLSFMCQTFLELPQHGAVEGDGASTTVSTTEVAWSSPPRDADQNSRQALRNAEDS